MYSYQIKSFYTGLQYPKKIQLIFERLLTASERCRDTQTGLNVHVPNHIITESTTAMDDLIQGTDAVQRNSTISAIAMQLSDQLVILHGRKIVQGSITRSNIVLLNGSNPVWTFREYCNFVGEGRDMAIEQYVKTARILPPEVFFHLVHAVILIRILRRVS